MRQHDWPPRIRRSGAALLRARQEDGGALQQLAGAPSSPAVARSTARPCDAMRPLGGIEYFEVAPLPCLRSGMHWGSASAGRLPQLQPASGRLPAGFVVGWARPGAPRRPEAAASASGPLTWHNSRAGAGPPGAHPVRDRRGACRAGAAPARGGREHETAKRTGVFGRISVDRTPKTAPDARAGGARRGPERPSRDPRIPLRPLLAPNGPDTMPAGPPPPAGTTRRKGEGGFRRCC